MPLAQQVQVDDPPQQAGAEVDRAAQGGRGERLVHHKHAVAGRALEDRVQPEQVVVQLSAAPLRVLLAFEVGEQPVEQEQPRRAARHRAAQAGQVVQLAERARERGLAALVGASHHHDAFRVVEAEVVAHHWRALADQLAGQRQVEHVLGPHLFGLAGDGREAQPQPIPSGGPVRQAQFQDADQLC
jgi:hypothetical protein